MADGRVANIVISPGIGCTVFTNDSGKALSATFFAQGISTNTNSKATVVVAGAGMTITKNEILWQPSLCIACYNGFIAAGGTVGNPDGSKNMCCAYPDPTKMGQAYTCGIFRSNVGSGRSGTPGYTCGLPRCWCGRSWYNCGYGNYCYGFCGAYMNVPGCFTVNGGGCITCTGGLYCCYELHYKCENCCATGGVRFARPHDVFVGVGTTFTGYCNPIPNTPVSLNCTCIGSHTKSYSGSNCCCGGGPNKEPDRPGRMTPWYLQCFHLSKVGVLAGCDCYSSKCGYEMGCFVPVFYGGTTVINPAIALTNPPLYNGTYSGYPTSNGACCWQCVCFGGPMWQTLITGWFPSDDQNCYDRCCAYFYCGKATCCTPNQQRNMSSLCASGTWGVGYLQTACHTPNVIDAAKRLIAPKDDAGVGAGMTGIPFCYCNNEPTWNNTQGGNPVNMQVACNRFGICLCITGICYLLNNCCDSQNTPIYSSGLQGNFLVDWYGLTDYNQWCHCPVCVGRLTKRANNLTDTGCYQCNAVNDGCQCCYVTMCQTRGCKEGAGCWNGTNPDSDVKKRLHKIIINEAWNGMVGVQVCICIKPCSTHCGRILYCADCCTRACRYDRGPRGMYYGSDSSRCYASGWEMSHTRRMGSQLPMHNTDCCSHWLLGTNQCCHLCNCWYCGCECGPYMGAPYNKSMGCCGGLLHWYCDANGLNCQCWYGYQSMVYDNTETYCMHASAGIPANPYGYHHGISCGLMMQFAGDGKYQIMPAALDWLYPFCWNNMCSSYCRRTVRPVTIQIEGPDEETRGCGGIMCCCSRAVDRYIYCAANVCEGLSNYWFTQCADASPIAAHCVCYSDDAGTVTCCIITEDGHPMYTWACSYAINCHRGTELPVKYFAYNPHVDCHYFMARTSQEYMNLSWPCFCKTWVLTTKTQAELDQCFVKGMKQCLFTREYCCGIFSVDCDAIMCYQSIRQNGACPMCYDGGTKHSEYAAYCHWGNDWCSGDTCCDTANGCCCCICWQPNYNTCPCDGYQFTECQHSLCYTMTLNPQGGRYCYTGLSGAGCFNECRGPSGIGTVFFRKVANFPSIMTDYKYTQPRMCVGCLFRSDNALWSLPVYNHCCFRWDTFITCDLINWNAQELSITCNPGDQMNSTSYCQILSLENNYYCKCTDCFMAGFDRSGLMELCMSFNQYERTGLVISNADSIYVKSHNTTDCFNFQVWGYEG